MWLGTSVDKLLRCGCLKSSKEIRHWFVFLRDTRHRDWSRNDAHLVCGVTLVLSLPQGVFAKPHLEVAVNCGHPRHWFGVFVVQLNPPRRITR